jgi:enoyl-CoA hydratase/carnithine racemase
MSTLSSTSFETITYEERNGVAWVTLNRPRVYNAFNATMQRELRTVWRALRRIDEVRAVVLTGAGDKAFCTGVDRNEALGDVEPDATAGEDGEAATIGSGETPFMFDDPGEDLGPKACDLWKPVVAAVNGIACGGAFYMLGEVDFIIATESATFFDPHVTFGMAASFEPIQMLGRMPFSELTRLTLLGSAERMSATRAHQIGLVSELATDLDDLRDKARWTAETIAASPPLAVQASLRALWAGRDTNRSQALAMGYAFVAMGNSEESLAEGQRRFASGTRQQWRLR